MQTQTIEFAVETKKGTVQKVGKSILLQPKTNFKGGSVKQYKDKPRQSGKQILPDKRADGSTIIGFDSLYVLFNESLKNL